MPVLHKILVEGVLDFAEDAFNLIMDCTARGVSHNMWTALTYLHVAFKRDCVE